MKLNLKQREAANVLSDHSKKYVMFWGGSRSGKTYLACRYIIIRALKYAGSKHLVGRFSFANAKKTIWLQTLYPMLKELERQGVCKVASQEGIARFANGSLIILGGLEPSRIDSILAAEYGTIFITEATENSFENIEPLFSRLNDTATDAEGFRIPLKFLIDLNPTTTNNWTNKVFRLGISPITEESIPNFHEYANVHFRPEDNSANLADGYIDQLKSLSPGQRRRFYEGEFGSYEGLVYQGFDESIHIVDDFPIPEHWQKGRSIDFGFVHPFVCLWTAVDPSNETIHVYRELYKTNTTVKVHSESIKRLSKETYKFTVCDHDAEDRATLSENGINNTRADKQVMLGIERITEFLDRGKIKVHRSCTNTINEFLSYRWKEASNKDREVVKEDDHAMDALRYGVLEWFPVNNKITVGKVPFW